MSAYCLFDNLEITDPAKLEEYKVHVFAVVQQYGGRYVVLGGKVQLVEGTWKPTYPVMIEFSARFLPAAPSSPRPALRSTTAGTATRC